MTSWRESVSEQAQEHIDELVNAALDAASAFLMKRGEFLPFGFWVDNDGEVAMFTVGVTLQKGADAVRVQIDHRARTDLPRSVQSDGPAVRAG